MREIILGLYLSFIFWLTCLLSRPSDIKPSETVQEEPTTAPGSQKCWHFKPASPHLSGAYSLYLENKIKIPTLDHKLEILLASKEGNSLRVTNLGVSVVLEGTSRGKIVLWWCQYSII